MNESADTIKYLIKQFIDEVADNTIILADGKKNVGSRVNKFVFDLESFFIKAKTVITGATLTDLSSIYLKKPGTLFN